MIKFKRLHLQIKFRIFNGTKIHASVSVCYWVMSPTQNDFRFDRKLRKWRTRQRNRHTLRNYRAFVISNSVKNTKIIQLRRPLNHLTKTLFMTLVLCYGKGRYNEDLTGKEGISQYTSLADFFSVAKLKLLRPRQTHTAVLSGNNTPVKSSWQFLFFMLHSTP